MKRLSLYLFLILFTLPTPSQADDIRDFQIEGMSVGDSLLDHFSEEEIKKNESSAFIWKTKFLINSFTYKSQFETYDRVQVAYKKNDKKYIIYGLDGVIFHKNNIEECYSKKDEIVEELSKIYANAAKKHAVTKKHELDHSGKSKSTVVEFWFNTGDLSRVICTDWSEDFEKNKNYWDDLAVILNLKEYSDFLMHEANY